MEEAGEGPRSSREGGERGGETGAPQVPQEGLGAPACAPGSSPNLRLSLPQATPLFLTSLLRSWCPVLGVKVKGHENSEHLTQGHM